MKNNIIYILNQTGYENLQTSQSILLNCPIPTKLRRLYVLYLVVASQVQIDGPMHALTKPTKPLLKLPLIGAGQSFNLTHCHPYISDQKVVIKTYKGSMNLMVICRFNWKLSRGISIYVYLPRFKREQPEILIIKSRMNTKVKES